MLQGADWKEVDKILQQRGLKLTGVAELSPSSAPPIPSQPPVQQRAAPQQQVRPAAVTAPKPQAITPAPAVVKTRWGKDKEIMFLFTQLESYFRSGIAPAQAFSNLSQSWLNKFRPALVDFSNAASAGRSIANEMERYPYLFPPHVVGIYRAGEMGGFLPEACAAISKQAEDSHRFKRWYVWLNWIFWASIACWPVVVWGVNGLMGSWDAFEKNPNATDPGKVVAGSMGEAFMRILPVTLGSIAAIVIGALIWSSIRLRPFRHKMVLAVPTTRNRARLESMAMFAWTLSNVMKGGAAPRTALEVAGQSMPNLHMSREILEKTRQMSAETPLSAVASQISAFRPEMRAMIQTGELTGELPNQLEQIYRVQRDEFQVTDQANKVRIGCWMLLVMLAASLLAYGLFQKLFYQGIMDRTINAPELTEMITR